MEIWVYHGTTVAGFLPSIYMVFYIPGGAGFLPSTVSINLYRYCIGDWYRHDSF